MENKVINMIREILENNGESKAISINSNSTLKDDLGLNSFDLATLTVMIEDQYGIDIFENDIVTTLGEIFEILKK